MHLSFLTSKETVKQLTTFILGKLKLCLRAAEQAEVPDGIEILHSLILSIAFILLKHFNQNYESLQVMLLSEYVGKALKTKSD